MNMLLKNRPEIQARALLLADRIDLKHFKIADCLATTPLTLQVDAAGGGCRAVSLWRGGVIWCTRF